MMWRTHLVAGVSSLWALKISPSLITREDWAFAIAGSMLGSLFPDLDASQSKIRYLGWDIGRNRIEPFQPLSFLIHRAFGHRGYLHSLGGWCLTASILLPITPWLGFIAWLGFVLGFGSHLVADALTRSGIPFWQLLPRKGRKTRRVHLTPSWLRISTGSAEEEIYFALFALGGLTLLLPFLLAPP